MGVTIHYKIAAPSSTDEITASALVAKMRNVAVRMQRAGRLDEVGPIGSSPEQLSGLSEWILESDPGNPHTTRGIEVPVSHGFAFTVLVGKDCESAQFGLCCFGRQRISTKKPASAEGHGTWRLSGSCKTQYANLHGWQHFKRCHTAMVDLLASCAALGLKVDITDEGNYWPTRDESTLRQKLDLNEGVIAAFAGALKDERDEDDGSIQAPIFGHPQFERLEAEGIARNRKKIRSAVNLARKRQR